MAASPPTVEASRSPARPTAHRSPKHPASPYRHGSPAPRHAAPPPQGEYVAVSCSCSSSSCEQSVRPRMILGHSHTRSVLQTNAAVKAHNVLVAGYDGCSKQQAVGSKSSAVPGPPDSGAMRLRRCSLCASPTSSN